MILSELKDYLQQNRVVNLHELIVHFDSDADTMREMLAIWIRKGKVQRLQKAHIHCEKCVQCHMLSAELYEWIDT